MGSDASANRDQAEAAVRDAAAQGAQVVLLPELFEGPYFCIDQVAEHLELARPVEGHPTIERFAALAAEPLGAGELDAARSIVTRIAPLTGCPSAETIRYAAW